MDEKTNVTGYVRFLYSKCIVVYLINLYISIYQHLLHPILLNIGKKAYNVECNIFFKNCSYRHSIDKQYHL